MTVRREISQSSSETGAQSREAGQHPAWEFHRGCAPFVGILQGGWLPCRSGRGRLQSRACDGREAYMKQYVDRTSGEPARRQACRSDVSAVAVEAFVNDAG